MRNEALLGNLALSDDSTNTVFGYLICHFVSFDPNMARNPAQADMFAYISELSVKLNMLKTVVLIISKLWIACREERESEYITNDFSFNRRISSRAILIAESSAVYMLDLSGRRMLLI